jgi:hypothetical protein
MLTADGTLCSARAAAEKEPWSITARKTSTLSLEKAMAPDLSIKLKQVNFLYQRMTHKVQSSQ